MEAAIGLASFIRALYMFYAITVHIIALLFSATLFLPNHQYILITFGVP